ncbi:MAG: GNAT family N-acetyltransferase [Chloroflexaceae bacterium]|nr:GNAT family N-acetyltransferase [Chloroflexaceae bacterium]
MTQNVVDYLPVESVPVSEFVSLLGLPAIAAETVQRQQPDQCLVLWHTDGTIRAPLVRARCALWWSNTPTYQHQQVGYIGQFAATDEQAAVAMLHSASAALCHAGCTLAVGPIDGNTWNTYRAVIERGDEPPFLLEPDTPDFVARAFDMAGFDLLATYMSDMVDDLRPFAEAQRGTRIRERLAERGVTLRPATDAELADPQQFVRLLQAIYRVSVEAFAHNLLYQPQSEAAFIEQYAAVKQAINPQLVWLAEHGEEVIGYCVTFPDWLPARRGLPVDTVIIKTVAVLPAWDGQGIGALLGEQCQQTAARLGFRRAIHALRHEDASACNLSRHYSTRTIRRYGLFACRLVLV